jgi:group I intron endonuclease
MVVYRLFCRVTGKSYIGATRQTFNARMHRHRTRAATATDKGTMYPLYVDVRKYGWDAFDCGVLSHVQSYDELYAAEKAAILLFRAMEPTGYNQIFDDHDRQKYWKGRTHAGWNKGIPHTPEARVKMSESHRGAENHRARAFEYQGIVYPCMQDAVKVTGLTRNQFYIRLKRGDAKYLTPGIPGKYGAPSFHHTDEAKRKMSEYRREHSARRRPILLDGKEYPSIVAAVGVSGYSRDQIKKQLKRGRATYLAAPPTQ